MKKKPEEKIDEDWMSTYGDMVTLLLCFFVMMLSVSKPDVAKYEQISAGLSEGLGKKIIQRPIEMLMTELNDDIQSLDLEKKVAIGSDTQGIVLEFGGDMLFNRGSADHKPEALPALKEWPPRFSRIVTKTLSSALKDIPATKKLPAKNILPTGNFLRLAHLPSPVFWKNAALPVSACAQPA